MLTYIKYLNNEVDRAIYVRGAQGENVSAMPDPELWITYMETTRRGDYYKTHKEECDRNAERAIALYRARVAAGATDICAFDCSGLTVRYGLDMELINKDYTAAGIYAKLCRPISGPATIRGQLVFRAGNGTPAGITHMGTYVGDGLVIECIGRDYGVIRQQYRPDDWTFTGEWPALMHCCYDMQPVDKINDPVAIEALQAALNQLGYVDADGHPLTVDGKLGKRTDAAIRYFIRYNMPDLIIEIERSTAALWGFVEPTN